MNLGIDYEAKTIQRGNGLNYWAFSMNVCFFHFWVDETTEKN